MMHPRLSAPLLLVLAACTSHEGPVTSSDPTPEPRRADVKVAVASVQLIQDCPDPPDVLASPTMPAPTPGEPSARMASQVAPDDAAMAGPRPAARMAPGAAMPGDSGWSPPCTQSTVQLSLTNSGEATGQVRITEMRLLDAASKRPIGKIAGRKPQQWHEASVYRPWDERVAPGQTLKVGYRLGEPDSGPPVDPSAPGSQTYILELDVAVDGRTQTVRSAEFVREPVHMIVT